MENEILLLKKTHIDWISEKLDDAFDFKEIIKNKIVGSIVESLDKRGAKIALDFSNIRVSQYIPDEYKDEIHKILDDIIDEDGFYTDSVNEAIALLNQLSDKIEIKPFIKSIIESLLELIKASLLILIEKKDKV